MRNEGVQYAGLLAKDAGRVRQKRRERALARASERPSADVRRARRAAARDRLAYEKATARRDAGMMAATYLSGALKPERLRWWARARLWVAGKLAGRGFAVVGTWWFEAAVSEVAGAWEYVEQSGELTGRGVRAGSKLSVGLRRAYAAAYASRWQWSAPGRVLGAGTLADNTQAVAELLGLMDERAA